MKKIFRTIVLFTIILSSCQGRNVDRRLIEIERKIAISTDNALSELEASIFPDDLDKYNKAYYYVLLTELRDKKEQKLLSADSLINYSLKILFDAGDDRLLARALISKGKIWEELETPQEALRCYHKALNLSYYNDCDLLTSAYACIGNIYIDQLLFDEAFNAFKSGYDKTITDKNLDNRYTNARNLGMAFFFKGQIDSSYTYFTEAFNHAGNLTDSVRLKDMIYNDLALYYNENNESELALSYINKISVLTDAYTLNKGAIYTSLEKYDSACVYLKKVMNSDDLGTRTVALNEISELEEKQGNSSEALIYLNMFIDAYDSLTTNTFSAEIHGLNQRHNIQTEINKLKNKYTSRILILISCFIVCFLAIIVVAITLNRKKKIRQKQERLVSEMKILQKEKRYLHFRN